MLVSPLMTTCIKKPNPLSQRLIALDARRQALHTRRDRERGTPMIHEA
jgi:hypothetical protein